MLPALSAFRLREAVLEDLSQLGEWVGDVVLGCLWLLIDWLAGLWVALWTARIAIEVRIVLRSATQVLACVSNVARASRIKGEA